MEDVDRAAAGAARCDALEKKGAGGLRLHSPRGIFFFLESILTLRVCIFLPNLGLRPFEVPGRRSFFFLESILTLRICIFLPNPGLRPFEVPAR